MTRLWAVGLLALAACAHGPSAGQKRITFDQCLRWLPMESINAVPMQRDSLPGQVVLISFDATWCFPCIADLAVFQKLQRDLGPKGFSLIEVGWDLEGEKVLRPYAESYELNFPVVLATPGMREGSSPFGRVAKLPTRFLFARDGSLQLAWEGASDASQLMAIIEREVAKK